MAAGSKVLEYIIGAKDATGSAIKSALARVKDFASKIGSNLMNIQAGFSMLGTAARKAMEFMRKAFAFETMTVQFKTLIGNMDEARAHMKMLQELGETPPFSLEEFAKASRTMMVMTDNALGFKKSLEMVGDAAAATGQPVETLAHEVGRAYAIIRDGQPITRATMALRNMGVLTPEVAARLDEMQKSGAKNIEVWNELEAALKKHNGAMAETEQTGEGLIGAISAQWDGTVREFGEAFLECSKDGLGALLEKMKEIRDDGSIQVWASKIIEAFNTIKEGASAVGTALKFVWEKSGLSDVLAVGQGMVKGSVYAVTRAAAGIKNGEGVLDALSAANREGEQVYAKNVVQGYWLGKIAEKGWMHSASAIKFAADDNKSDAEHEANKEEEIRERVRSKKREKEKQAAADKAKREAEEEERINKSLADAQRKQDAKRAEELKKAEEAAAKKRAEEDAKNREKEEAERQRIEDKLARERERKHQKEIRDKEKDLTRLNNIQAKAQQDLSEAQNKVREAWGWYRDKDKFKEQLKEEKAEAAAQKQFDKDFAKLKDRRRDWRTADNLSLDDEAVRRVGLAREAEAEAQKRLDEIAENTRELADKIEELLTMEE